MRASRTRRSPGWAIGRPELAESSSATDAVGVEPCDRAAHADGTFLGLVNIDA